MSLVVTIQVAVLWVVTPCVVVGYQHLRGPCRWRQHGPLKRWYPTITLTRRHNPRDRDISHLFTILHWSGQRVILNVKKTSVEHRWNDDRQGKVKVFGLSNCVHSKSHRSKEGSGNESRHSYSESDVHFFSLGV
jgi:hypothetical protein